VDFVNNDLFKAELHYKLFGDKDRVKEFLTDGKITLTEYQSITGDDLVDIDIELAREAKRAEIKKACNEEIRAGFYSSVINGEEHLYGYNNTETDPDQANWQGVLNSINAGIFTDVAPAKWKGGDIQWIPVDTYKLLMQDAMNHQFSKTDKCSQLEAQLDLATTIEEILNIVW
jgi:hypothetical protein